MAKKNIASLTKMKEKLILNIDSKFSENCETMKHVDKCSSECMDINLELPQFSNIFISLPLFPNLKQER